LGAPWPPFFFSYFASKMPETLVVRADTDKKHSWPYRTTFPNRETPYGIAGGVPWPYRTGFLPETEWGGVSCNLDFFTNFYCDRNTKNDILSKEANSMSNGYELTLHVNILFGRKISKIVVDAYAYMGQKPYKG